MWIGQVYFVFFNYIYWYFGQFNNIVGVQDCLVIEYLKYDYEWGDVLCFEKYLFICEMNFDLKVQIFVS